jgi:hypothetical protein
MTSDDSEQARKKRAAELLKEIETIKTGKADEGLPAEKLPGESPGQYISRRERQIKRDRDRQK